MSRCFRNKLRLYGCVLLCFVIIEVNSRTSECLKVKIPNLGTVVGRYKISHDGKGIRAFMGIPYAEPPVGDLRFKPPQRKSPWRNELDATKDSPICIQRDPFRRDYEIQGSEDCLYLNVYTPSEPRDELLPVMIFFHGGGWECGSGISDYYGPDYMMDHDIIYVGANFRLGPLGFLSTGQQDCPGNNGLKDQVAILKWIQEYIKAFGGDPNRVTVFGESAGGASGTYHMMSPLSRGLFQGVISQSGTNLDPWAQPAHTNVAETRAAKLGELVGCPLVADNWKAMIACLRTKPAEDITAALYDFFAWDTDPMIPFPPVVEYNHPQAFITKHPRDETEPWGLGLPWITGITKDEGAMKSAPIINMRNITDHLNINWNEALPIALNYDHQTPEKQKKITEEISKYYFNNEKLHEGTRQNLTNLFTDGWFLSGMDEYLRIRLLGGVENIKTKSDSSTTENKSASKTSDGGVAGATANNKAAAGPTYVYLFAHKGEASFTEIFHGGKENYYGVCHAEELQYLFPIAQGLFVSATPTENCKKIRQSLTKMWVNFAKYGNPTPKLDNKDTDLPQWLPTNSYPLEYLRMGYDRDVDDVENISLFAMEKGLLEERGKLWQQLRAHVAKEAENGTQKDEL